MGHFKKIKIILSLFLLVISFFKLQASTNKKTLNEYSVTKIAYFEIQSTINPSTFNYLQTSFKKAKEESNQLFVVSLNTPGGLVSTTKEILTIMGESSIPIVIWVRPAGASATSAGAIIASGAHFLVMSEGTNIGAATPVQMGKGLDKNSDMRAKAVNDLVALTAGLSLARKRNPAPFKQMIEKAASFDSQSALKEKLINGLSNTRNELTSLLNGSEVFIQDQRLKLNLQSPKWTHYPMDLGQKLLNILASPSTAYILFLIGAALIYLEFQAPGGFIAGSIGALLLLLSGIGFQVLPLNAGALGLIILSFILFVIEAFITSYGMISIAGLASLIAGSLFLYRTDDSYIHFSKNLIFGSVSAILFFLGFIAYIILKDRRKNNQLANFNQLQGLQAIIIKPLESSLSSNPPFLYQVKVAGEFWKAQSQTPKEAGELVTIKEQLNQQVLLNIE